MAYATRTAFGVINNIDAIGAAAMFSDFISDPERLLAWHTIFCIITAIVVSKGVKSGLEGAVVRLNASIVSFITSVGYFLCN